MNLHVHSAHPQRKSLACEHNKRVEKRWRITRADIRPGVYGPLGLKHYAKQNIIFKTLLAKTYFEQPE